MTRYLRTLVDDVSIDFCFLLNPHTTKKASAAHPCALAEAISHVRPSNDSSRKRVIRLQQRGLIAEISLKRAVKRLLFCKSHIMRGLIGVFIETIKFIGEEIMMNELLIEWNWSFGEGDEAR